MTDVASVERALAEIPHPDFGKPLAALGLLRDVATAGERATMTIVCNAPSDALQRSMQASVEAALAPLGVREVQIDWDLQVPMRATSADDPVPGVRNVVLVMSGKGGVGKSTCAVNLALGLTRAGARVGLLDADIYGPSVPTMLGVSGHPQANDDKKIIPLKRLGLKLMSIGFMIESDKDAIIWRGPMVQGALMQFLGDVMWGELDYLLIDMPPGTGDVALSLGQKLKTTGAVMVTTPQEVALQDVYKGVSMCQKLKVPVLGVIENMSHFVDSAGVRHELFGAGGGQKVAEYADTTVLGQVPMEVEVRQWGDDGTPIVHAKPDAPASRAFVQIADALARDIAKRSFARAGGDRAPETRGQRRLKILR